MEIERTLCEDNLVIPLEKSITFINKLTLVNLIIH